MAFDRPDPEVLHGYLARSAQRFPDQVALVAGGSRLTYRELADDVTALARSLVRLGVRPGDRVVVLAEGGTTAAVAFWAVLAAGGVAVMVNPATPPDKLAWLVEDCEPSALVAPAGLAAVAAAVTGPSLRAVVVDDPAAPGVIGSAPAVDLAAALASGRDGDGPLPARRGADVAALIYTSGSTGEPKAVVLTHANMVAAATSISTYLRLTADDVVLGVLPLSFDYGLYQLILSVRQGARLVLERSFGLPGQVLNRIVAERVTVLPGVPTMFAMLARLGDLGRWDLSSVTTVTSTASALSLAQIDWLRATFPGARVFSMYGLTECKRCTYLPPEDLDRKPGSVGIAIPGTELWVVDPDDRVLGPGEVGELVVSGPTVMAGYWRRPEETARRLRPGPRPGERVLYTGDLCRLDEDGYLHVVGRMDDVIKSSGEKVAPAEVEAALLAVPGVLEAAVVGVPDDVLGQSVTAFVVLDDRSTLTPAGLRRACRERLEPFMVPRTVEVVAALPRTPNGKIGKQALVRTHR